MKSILSGRQSSLNRFFVNPLKPSILVADDEHDVVNMVSQSLLRAGFQVIAAEDGPTTLNKARNFLPAMVVLDVMMPGLTGFEICRQLKGDPGTAEISVIMLTAKVDEEERVYGLEIGADDYMTKPFSPRELVLRVQSILIARSLPAVVQRFSVRVPSWWIWIGTS